MRYFSMFSGIGGFERGIEDAIGTAEPECVGYSEIDKYATAIYRYHYPKHINYGDATNIIPDQLPKFDLLVGGFPCQAFSIAGRRGGFDDTRGTLFFDVARILEVKKPAWVLLENVKGLVNHDSSKTLATIYGVLSDIGYSVGYEVVNSCHFGVPQNRERIFIVGRFAGSGRSVGQVLPVPRERSKPDGIQRETESQQQGVQSEVPQVQRKDVEPESGRNGFRRSYRAGTWRTHKDGQGFREVESNLCPTIPARAREDGSGQPVVKAVLTPDRVNKRQNGRRFKENNESSFTLTSQDRHGVQVGTSIRRLTPIEYERLQGFPDGWTRYGVDQKGNTFEVSDAQRYKTVGNSVTTNVVRAFIKQILKVYG